MIQPAVRARCIVIQFQITRVVEGAVAALALEPVLRHQEFVHLGPTHLVAFRLLNSFLDAEERSSLLAIVCAFRRLGP